MIGIGNFVGLILVVPIIMSLGDESFLGTLQSVSRSPNFPRSLWLFFLPVMLTDVIEELEFLIKALSTCFS